MAPFVISIFSRLRSLYTAKKSETNVASFYVLYCSSNRTFCYFLYFICTHSGSTTSTFALDSAIAVMGQIEFMAVIIIDGSI